MYKVKQVFNQSRVNGECSIVVENMSELQIEVLLEECFSVTPIGGENGKKLYIISN